MASAVKGQLLSWKEERADDGFIEALVSNPLLGETSLREVGNICLVSNIDGSVLETHIIEEPSCVQVVVFEDPENPKYYRIKAIFGRARVGMLAVRSILNFELTREGKTETVRGPIAAMYPRNTIEDMKFIQNKNSSGPNTSSQTSVARAVLSRIPRPPKPVSEPSSPQSPLQEAATQPVSSQPRPIILHPKEEGQGDPSQLSSDAPPRIVNPSQPQRSLSSGQIPQSPKAESNSPPQSPSKAPPPGIIVLSPSLTQRSLELA